MKALLNPAPGMDSIGGDGHTAPQECNPCETQAAAESLMSMLRTELIRDMGQRREEVEKASSPSSPACAPVVYTRMDMPSPCSPDRFDQCTTTGVMVSMNESSPTAKPTTVSSAGCAASAMVVSEPIHCVVAGCLRVAKEQGKCDVHRGMKLCQAPNCFRPVQSRGRCKSHGGGARCRYPGCSKGAISKGRCRLHGGGTRCALPGCTKWAQRYGYCVRHSKEQRHD